MNKAQALLLLAVGATSGVVGTKLSEASPAPAQIRVHALDLRVGDLPDGGSGPVLRIAYGTLLRPDAGTKDIGQAKKCIENPARQAALAAELAAAASECVWEL